MGSLKLTPPHSRAAWLTGGRAKQRQYKSNWHQDNTSSKKNEVVSVLKAANYLAGLLCVTTSIRNAIMQWDFWLLPLLFQTAHCLLSHLYILLLFYGDSSIICSSQGVHVYTHSYKPALIREKLARATNPLIPPSGAERDLQDERCAGPFGLWVPCLAPAPFFWGQILPPLCCETSQGAAQF